MCKDGDSMLRLSFSFYDCNASAANTFEKYLDLSTNRMFAFLLSRNKI